MKRLISVALATTAAVGLYATCSSPDENVTSGSDRVRDEFDQRTDQTVPADSGPQGYEWDDPAISALIDQNFPSTIWDQQCVHDALEATYATPVEFHADVNEVGAVEVTRKTGVVACYTAGM